MVVNVQPSRVDAEDRTLRLHFPKPICQIITSFSSDVDARPIIGVKVQLYGARHGFSGMPCTAEMYQPDDSLYKFTLFNIQCIRSSPKSLVVFLTDRQASHLANSVNARVQSLVPELCQFNILDDISKADISNSSIPQAQVPQGCSKILTVNTCKRIRWARKKLMYVAHMCVQIMWIHNGGAHCLVCSLQLSQKFPGK